MVYIFVLLSNYIGLGVAVLCGLAFILIISLVGEDDCVYGGQSLVEVGLIGSPAASLLCFLGSGF